MRLLIVLVTIFSTFSFGNILKPKIVGGQFASDNQFPYQVALIYRGSIRCGGSILTEKFILTAAHCLVERNGLKILAGTNKLSNGGITRDVAEQIPHENYGNFMNDIALLKLQEPLTFDDSIKPIELGKEELPTGAQVVISGWGKISNDGTIPNQLKFNTLTVLNKLDCTTGSGIFHDGILCLGHSINNGACNGDSGGPATYDNKLVGVANFVVYGCGSMNPDGYARVSYFVDWINLKIEETEKLGQLILF